MNLLEAAERDPAVAAARDSRLYTAAMRVCGAAGKRDKVLALFERMRAAGKDGGGRGGGGGKGAWFACCVTGRWSEACARAPPHPHPSVYQWAGRRGAGGGAGEEGEEGSRLSDYIAYNSVLEALKMEGDWRQALRVLQDMKAAGLGPNLVNHNTVGYMRCEGGRGG